MAGTDWYYNPFDSDALDLGDDFQLDADFSFDFGLYLDNTAANAPVIGTWPNELFPPQEQAYDHATTFASADADIPADQTLGDMSGTDESTDVDSKHDSPMSIRTGRDTVLAGSSTGNHQAGNIDNTLPTPTASNKRRRGTQDEAEGQRPARRRATTSVAPPIDDAPLAPLPLGPVTTIVRGTCQTATPPQRHWNANAESANRQGKRPGWAQARRHHHSKCNPFVVGGCHEGCSLRKKYPATTQMWEEQWFLIEWKDNHQQEVVNGFFIDAQGCSQREFMVRGELDTSGNIHKKSKKVSCWDAYEPSP